MILTLTISAYEDSLEVASTTQIKIENSRISFYQIAGPENIPSK